MSEGREVDCRGVGAKIKRLRTKPPTGGYARGYLRNRMIEADSSNPGWSQGIFISAIGKTSPFNLGVK